MNKITDRDSYLSSIKNRNLKIYLMGELVKEPLENPIIKPSIEAMAETYELAVREPELASVTSPYTGEKINRMKNCNIVFNAPAKRVDRIQELHILVGHIICELIENEI